MLAGRPTKGERKLMGGEVRPGHGGVLGACIENENLESKKPVAPGLL